MGSEGSIAAQSPKSSDNLGVLLGAASLRGIGPMRPRARGASEALSASAAVLSTPNNVAKCVNARLLPQIDFNDEP